MSCSSKKQCLSAVVFIDVHVGSIIAFLVSCDRLFLDMQMFSLTSIVVHVFSSIKCMLFSSVTVLQESPCPRGLICKSLSLFLDFKLLENLAIFKVCHGAMLKTKCRSLQCILMSVMGTADAKLCIWSFM